jgi:hypothetical protein
MLSILLGMEEEDKAFLSYPSFNFLVVRVFILSSFHRIAMALHARRKGTNAALITSHVVLGHL